MEGGEELEGPDSGRGLDCGVGERRERETHPVPVPQSAMRMLEERVGMDGCRR